MLFIHRISLIWSFSFIYFDMCVNRYIDVDLRVVLDGSSFWADWHHCILYSTHHSSLPEIRIIITRIYNLFQSLNVIDKIIIVFIHSWLVSMVTEFIK